MDDGEEYSDQEGGVEIVDMADMETLDVMAPRGLPKEVEKKKKAKPKKKVIKKSESSDEEDIGTSNLEREEGKGRRKNHALTSSSPRVLLCRQSNPNPTTMPPPPRSTRQLQQRGRSDLRSLLSLDDISTRTQRSSRTTNLSTWARPSTLRGATKRRLTPTSGEISSDGTARRCASSCPPLHATKNATDFPFPSHPPGPSQPALFLPVPSPVPQLPSHPGRARRGRQHGC